MTASLAEFLKLAPLGFAVGLYGTLIGAGGGFLLVPMLLIFIPEMNPATVTSTSLAVVFFNAYSGTMAYVRMGKIDYFAGLLFILAGLPGAVFGPLAAHSFPRASFEPVFGIVLLAVGAWLAWQPFGGILRSTSISGARTSPPGTGTADHFNTWAGAVGCAYIGLVSSVLGIGGGVIQVPFLIRVLRFPPHTAIATSQLVLAALALVATITHYYLGAFHTGIDRTLYLAVGVMMGAPIGAMISTRIQGAALIRLLALALCVVGIRLLGGAWLKS